MSIKKFAVILEIPYEAAKKVSYRGPTSGEYVERFLLDAESAEEAIEMAREDQRRTDNDTGELVSVTQMTIN